MKTTVYKSQGHNLRIITMPDMNSLDRLEDVRKHEMYIFTLNTSRYIWELKETWGVSINNSKKIYTWLTLNSNRAATQLQTFKEDGSI